MDALLQMPSGSVTEVEGILVHATIQHTPFVLGEILKQSNRLLCRDQIHAQPLTSSLLFSTMPCRSMIVGRVQLEHATRKHPFSIGFTTSVESFVSQCGHCGGGGHSFIVVVLHRGRLPPNWAVLVADPNR